MTATRFLAVSSVCALLLAPEIGISDVYIKVPPSLAPAYGAIAEKVAADFPFAITREAIKAGNVPGVPATSKIMQMLQIAAKFDDTEEFELRNWYEYDKPLPQEVSGPNEKPHVFLSVQRYGDWIALYTYVGPAHLFLSTKDAEITDLQQVEILTFQPSLRLVRHLQPTFLQGAFFERGENGAITFQPPNSTVCAGQKFSQICSALKLDPRPHGYRVRRAFGSFLTHLAQGASTVSIKAVSEGAKNLKSQVAALASARHNKVGYVVFQGGKFIEITAAP